MREIQPKTIFTYFEIWARFEKSIQFYRNSKQICYSFESISIWWSDWKVYSLINIDQFNTLLISTNRKLLHQLNCIPYCRFCIHFLNFWHFWYGNDFLLSRSLELLWFSSLADKLLKKIFMLGTLLPSLPNWSLIFVQLR